jgi:site-specific DNA-cytosine methylase
MKLKVIDLFRGAGGFGEQQQLGNAVLPPVAKVVAEGLIAQI